MNDIVELKNPNNSVDSVILDCISEDVASSWQERVATSFYDQLAVETPTQNFQRINDRTNEKINIYQFMNFICNQNYFFANMDKRGKRRISFSASSKKCIDRTDYQVLHEGSTSTWTENISEKEIVPKLQRGSRYVVNRLKKFATLKSGWDSYNAKPIKWTTISRAIKFFYTVLCAMENEKKDVIPLPFIAPRSDGGIQFEWSTCYKELIHSIPQKKEEPIEYLKVDVSSGEEKEEEGEVSGIDNIVDLVTEWLLKIDD